MASVLPIDMRVMKKREVCGWFEKEAGGRDSLQALETGWKSGAGLANGVASGAPVSRKVERLSISQPLIRRRSPMDGS